MTPSLSTRSLHVEDNKREGRAGTLTLLCKDLGSGRSDLQLHSAKGTANCATALRYQYVLSIVLVGRTLALDHRDGLKPRNFLGDTRFVNHFDHA